MLVCRRLSSRTGEAYVVICSLLAALAIFPADVDYVSFYVLVVVTLPVSLVAVTIQYLGGILLFGLDQDGLLPRTSFFVLWVVLITLQMVTVRTLIRSRSFRPRA